MTTVKSTFDKLVEALQSKGLKHEVRLDPNGRYDRVGFKWKNKDTYHWFEFYNGEYPKFLESYSQINGTTKRGLRQGMKVKSSIEKKLKIDMYYYPDQPDLAKNGVKTIILE